MNWKKIFAALCALLLMIPSLGALGEEGTGPEGEEAAEEVIEEVMLEDAPEAEAGFADVEPLPVDFTPGHVAQEQYFTDNSFEDESIRVQLERVTTDTALYNVARVSIADPTQLRTYVTRNRKVSFQAKKMNAIVAIGGDYYASDKGGYIVRQGEVIEKRKSPYETRDLLCIDENGDFHILLRIRNAKLNGKSKSINPDFAAQLKALVQEHTLINVFEWGPALVIDGEVQEIPESYSGNILRREPRCAIGQTGPLSYVMVVVDTLKHHDRSGKEGATGEDLAKFMADLGCQQAYNLDGGNSALMYFHGQNYSDKKESEERTVSDIIYFATAVDAGLDDTAE